ncbi:hypothetical protein Glove_213g19 [Diversispora epigaea]|uniref:Uncharacterized protein n=1 Tax=Diversispora epigaea TaxID=1348612 RepID=A0A397IMT0_9GLOM|nr:hypothetical protein Glove_213g19 [Diversispora epigaea]
MQTKIIFIFRSGNNSEAENLLPEFAQRIQELKNSRPNTNTTQTRRSHRQTPSKRKGTSNKSKPSLGVSTIQKSRSLAKENQESHNSQETTTPQQQFRELIAEQQELEHFLQ